MPMIDAIGDQLKCFDTLVLVACMVATIPRQIKGVSISMTVITPVDDGSKVQKATKSKFSSRSPRG